MKSLGHNYMKSLGIKTLLTERYKDKNSEVFRRMTNRVRTVHQSDDGQHWVELHGDWWTIYPCPGGPSWDRAYLGDKFKPDNG